MAPFPCSDATPVLASISCYRCRQLDVPCMLPVGSRSCVHCSQSRSCCRITRGGGAVARRFRDRLAKLRSALTEVLRTLDSVDLYSSDPAGWSSSFSLVL
jgi:hypothetical protein